MNLRVGVGYDLHRLVAGRPLVLGGVAITHERGLAGHSDGDAVLHAIADAMLGAAGLDDIGAMFPPGDERFASAASDRLLGEVRRRVQEARWRLMNVDVTVVAEEPRLGPYREAMRRSIASILGIPEGAVGLKAKTNEGLDAVGRSEAVAVHAVALLVKEDES